MNAQSIVLATQVSVPGSHWDGAAAADIFVPCGTPVLAVFDGICEPIDVPLGGYAAFLTAADGMAAYYAHMLPSRASGLVSAGDVIGYVSDSGNAKGTGCHLHFAVGVIDSNGAGTIQPAAFLSSIDVVAGGNGIDVVANGNGANLPLAVDINEWIPYIVMGGLIAMAATMR